MEFWTKVLIFSQSSYQQTVEGKRPRELDTGEKQNEDESQADWTRERQVG